MSYILSRVCGYASLGIAVSLLSASQAEAADVIAGPGDAGLRAAIAAAQEDDRVILQSHVELQAPLEINKRLTLRSSTGDPHTISIRAFFDGELFHIREDGITFEGIGLTGSEQTDGFRVEANVVLRDCYIQQFRWPVIFDFWSETTVRLERCHVIFNEYGFEAPVLEAKDSIFSNNGKGFGGIGVSGRTVFLDGCRIEGNYGMGLGVAYGTVKNCTFRYNAGFGLWCDADPGELSVSSSLFYANTEGGLVVGEQVVATVDNCTFTRHAGSPAVYVSSDVTSASFRHCTITDNAFFESEHFPRQRIGSGAFTIERPDSVTLQNCLVADNPTSGSPHGASISGSWIDGGGNVIGGPANVNVLANNGGPTLTMLPLPGSPAIDAGIPSDLTVDARGLSRLAGSAPDAGAIETAATPPADADGDGLPDLWETFHGLNKNDASDATSDADGDGQNALAEFLSHTDPDDPQSVLRFVEARLAPRPALPPDPRTTYFLWNHAPGLMYEVETSTDLQQWHKVAGTFFPAGTLDGRPAMSFETQAQSGMSFYRVRVKPDPFE